MADDVWDHLPNDHDGVNEPSEVDRLWLENLVSDLGELAAASGMRVKRRANCIDILPAHSALETLLTACIHEGGLELRSHRNSELTRRYSGKRIRDAWLREFMIHHAEAMKRAAREQLRRDEERRKARRREEDERERAEHIRQLYPSPETRRKREDSKPPSAERMNELKSAGAFLCAVCGGDGGAKGECYHCGGTGLTRRD